MAIANNSIVDDVYDARAAHARWQAQPLRARLQVVKRFRQMLAERCDELCAALVGEHGRQRSESIAAEILPLAAACKFLERHATRILQEERHGNWLRWLGVASVALTVRREPLGVVLVIAPSNYSLFLPTVQVLQALVAGNAVLLKPGTGGSGVARLAAQLLCEAGLPPHVLTVLGEAAGDAMQAIDAEVDKVILTGSAATGREVLTQLAGHLTPAVMELSGCDPLFVLPGADLQRVAAAIVFSLRLNHGATCMAPRRIFVEESQYEPLLTRLRPLVRALPAAPAEQHLQARGAELVDEALASGIEVIQGQPARDAFAPAVIVGDYAHTLLACEDIFLPITTVRSFSTLADAPHMASQCHYRLSASIFGDMATARELAAQLNVGCVTINDVIAPTADPRVPFCGRGESGFGTSRGAEGLLEMTQLKAVVERHGHWLPHLDPPHERDAELLAAWLRFSNATSFPARFAALSQLFHALRSRS